jgi:hypothetical protein
MPRPIPESLKEALRRGNLRSHSTLRLNLNDGTTRKYASGAIQIGEDEYTPHIKQGSAIRQSLSRSVDGATFSLITVGDTLGIPLAAARELLIGAPVIIGKWYGDEESDRTWHVTLMRGVVNNVKGESTTISLEIVSDIAALGQIGNRTAFRTCQTKWKGTKCGAVSTRPACNKQPNDTTNGCIVLHRFYGFPWVGEPSQSAQTANNQTYGNATGGGGGGTVGWSRDRREVLVL